MLKRVTPAVVNISATGQVEALDHPLFDDPFFRRFFGPPGGPRYRESRSIGSGVIVDAAKGIVITNHHVIAEANDILVVLNDDREFEAEVVGSDPATDLAVLKIEADNLTALPLGDSDQLQVGDFVVAVGNPFGLRQTVTSGIVSGLGRSGLGNRYENFIQTDASINPGNSGGALVNLEGELVGINSAILSRTGGNIGIGFAIPTNLASAVMSQILETGEVNRGRLGIVGQDLTSELAQAFGLERTRGVVVAQVLPGSAADKAGIRSGDIIAAVNGEEIRDFAQLRNSIGLLQVGDRLALTLIRDGRRETVTAILDKPEEPTAATGNAIHPGLAGAAFGALGDDHPLAGELDGGVVVVNIAPGSPAQRHGLRQGDVITSVNRQPVSTVADLRAAVGKGANELLLHLRRGRGAMFILIR